MTTHTFICDCQTDLLHAQYDGDTGGCAGGHEVIREQLSLREKIIRCALSTNMACSSQVLVCANNVHQLSNSSNNFRLFLTFYLIQLQITIEEYESSQNNL